MTIQILVVDDNKLIRTILADFLTQLGHSVLHAESGEEALALFQSERPPLIILDWMMPGMSGLEVCSRIRQMPDGEDTLIMMLTAKDSNEDVERAINAGANDYLFKPLDKKLLQIRLQIAGGQIKIIRMRKHAMAALDKSEFRYRLLAEHTADMIWMTDRDGRFAYISPAVTRIAGYGVDEALSMGLNDFFTGQAIILLTEAMANLQAAAIQAGDTSQMIELELTCKDGRRIWTETRLTFFAREDNDQPRFVGVTRDITARKEAEGRLGQKENIIAKIASTTPNLLYIFNLREQSTTYVNREAIAALLGYPIEEVQSTGQDFFLMKLHPDDYLQWIENLGSVLPGLSDQDIVEFEFRLKHANGHWRWFQTREVVFIRDENGRVISILGSAQDMSEQIALRRMVDQAKQELEAIADALEEPLFMLASDGTVLRCNRRASELLGRPFQEVVQSNITVLLPGIQPPHDSWQSARELVPVQAPHDGLRYAVRALPARLGDSARGFIYVLRPC